MIITLHGMAGPVLGSPREEIEPNNIGFSVHGGSNQLAIYLHSIEAAEAVANAALSIVAQMRVKTQRAEAAE